MISGRMQCDVCSESAELLFVRVDESNAIAASAPVRFRVHRRLINKGQRTAKLLDFHLCGDCDAKIRTTLEFADLAFWEPIVAKALAK